MKIAYLLMRWFFGLAVLVFRGDRAKDAELLVLGHENAVLRRTAGRVWYEPADRAWFAALAPFLPRRQRAGVFPVTPTTVLAWHRRLVARKYDTSTRRRPGRPPTVRSTARIAVRLARENPLCGYRRIHGELTKLGVNLAASTVYEILRAAGIDTVQGSPGQQPNPIFERHNTAATLLLEQGTDIRVVQQILGHSQLSQTQRYTHVTAALNQDAADRMSDALWG